MPCFDKLSMTRLVLAKHELIDEAILPLFARLNRLHDWVFGRVKVFCRMLVLG